MNENDKLNITNEDLAKAFTEASKENNFSLKNAKRAKTDKSYLVFLIIGIISFFGGLGCLLFSFFSPVEEREALTFPKIPSKKTSEEIYSSLTGEALADASLKTAPAFCIQTPNGTDGARPQAGLNQAGVVFEAIAEAGITRFAAIYQNPTSAVIGPIRSLRIYYLEWDTPFDCTIVHAGGSGDALAAVSRGGYKDLTENYTYMYRGTYSGRLWNNLFTTSAHLKQFSADRGYDTSNINGFKRMTPEEAKKERVDKTVTEKLVITKPANSNTSEINPSVSAIGFRFGGSANFNVSYNYDIDSNTYLRSYESGVAHEVYSCPTDDLGDKNPEDVCNLVQVAPSVVIAMVVSEHRASDNYHEDITVTDSGKAYVFQNGTVTQGTWNKATKDDQIKFLDESGTEIELVPGQTFISAVPNYGSVDF